MDPQFVQWMVGQTGLGAFAAVVLWMLNDNNKRHLAQIVAIQEQRIAAEKEAKEQLERLYNKTETALDKNTQAMVNMTVTLREVFITHGQKPTQ
jgi:hypothetical protein